MLAIAPNDMMQSYEYLRRQQKYGGGFSLSNFSPDFAHHLAQNDVVPNDGGPTSCQALITNEARVRQE